MQAVLFLGPYNPVNLNGIRGVSSGKKTHVVLTTSPRERIAAQAFRILNSNDGIAKMGTHEVTLLTEREPVGPTGYTPLRRHLAAYVSERPTCEQQRPTEVLTWHCP